MSTRSSTPAPALTSSTISPVRRLAVAVDDQEGGRDAFALARVLAGSPEADLIAMTVMPDFSLIAPWAGPDPMRHDIERRMRQLRDEWHPHARIAIERDRSVARGLMRLVRRNHRELLVVGSGHRAAEGQVWLSGHARQLIGQLPCPLVLAPRGLASRRFAVRRIGVGVDGDAASVAALTSAARLAATTGAELMVCGVVESEPPGFGWPGAMAELRTLWSDSIAGEVTTLQATLRELTEPLQPPATIEVRRGAPPEVLTALSKEVDLLVLGSRRWGTVARLVLGGTGEALVHRSRSPLVIVPRPPAPSHEAHELQ